jgi:hypothetical protein
LPLVMKLGVPSLTKSAPTGISGALTFGVRSPTAWREPSTSVRLPKSWPATPAKTASPAVIRKPRLLSLSSASLCR